MAFPAQRPSPRPARPTWSLPQLDHWLLVPFIVVLLTATAGRLLVYSPGIAARETELLRRLHEARLGLLDGCALAAHHVFSVPGAFAIIVALTAWLVLVRRRPWDAAGFATTALSGWAAVALLKVVVGRPRPDASALTEPLLQVDGLTSFPSGHTGAAVAIAVALALAVRRSGRAPAVLAGGLAFAALVGLSRAYLGVHYPLDVLAALPAAWAGSAVGCGLANILVPALAYGFGWEQPDAGWSAGADAAGDTSAAGAPIPDAPARDAQPATARVPVTARQLDHRVDHSAA